MGSYKYDSKLISFFGRLSYDFDGKYLVTASLRREGSSKFGYNPTWGNFPAVSAGWRISQEGFLKGSDIVNDLMLSVSASTIKTDMDINGYYLYSTNYTTGGWYSWAPGGRQASYPARGKNARLDFITRKELSATLRGSLFRNFMDFNATFFAYKTEGLVINNSSKFPSYFSTYSPEASFTPYLNNDANRRIGFDFGVNFKKEIGDLFLSLGVNGTYYKTKALKRDEVWENDYQ